MEKKEINLNKYSIYFDGRDIFFGVLQQVEEDLWLFVNFDKTGASYIVKEEINADFKTNRRAVMVLRDAIIGNVYGKDRNRGLENAGLDEKENEYIKRLYRVTEFDYSELVKHQQVLREKIRARMHHANCEEQYLKEKAKYATVKNHKASENDWIKILEEAYDKARGAYAVANKNFNRALEELKDNMTESEAQ